MYRSANQKPGRRPAYPSSKFARQNCYALIGPTERLYEGSHWLPGMQFG